MMRYTKFLLVTLMIDPSFGLTLPPASVSARSTALRTKKSRISRRPRPVMSVTTIDLDDVVADAAYAGSTSIHFPDAPSVVSVAVLDKRMVTHVWPTSVEDNAFDAWQPVKEILAMSEPSTVETLFAGLYCSACVSVGMAAVRAHILLNSLSE